MKGMLCQPTQYWFIIVSVCIIMKGMLCQPTQVLVYYCISVYHNERNAVSAHSGMFLETTITVLLLIYKESVMFSAFTVGLHQI